MLVLISGNIIESCCCCSKVQVLLARKAWISSHIALCHASYLLASLRTSGSWVGRETTQLKEAAAAVVVEVDSAVLDCWGRRTMGCWWAARRGEGEPVHGSCWRGYEKRSTQSCSPAGEAVEGLVCAADTGEAAVELGVLQYQTWRQEHLAMGNLFLHNDHLKNK